MPRGARRRLRTRAALLSAAESEFARHGFARTRVEDIAERADVAVGSVYGHFQSKEGLYLAVAEQAVELFASYLSSGFRAEWSPLEQVVACGDAYLRFHLDHPGSFRFLALPWPDGSDPGPVGALSVDLTRSVRAIVDRFEATVAAAVASGEARPHVDPYLTARFLWGAWNGVVALGLRSDELALDDSEIEAALQQAREIVLWGLCSPERRDRSGAPIYRLVDTR